MAEIEGDVEINFWIENPDTGEIVTSGLDTIYLGTFEEKIEITKLFLPSNVQSGTYNFIITVSLNDYSASSYRTIEIAVDEEEKVAEIVFVSQYNFLFYLLIGLGVLLILIIIIVLIKVPKVLEYLKKHKIIFIVILLIIVGGILVYFFSNLVKGIISTSFDFLKGFLAQNLVYVLIGLGIIILVVSIILIHSKKNLNDLYRKPIG